MRRRRVMFLNCLHVCCSETFKLKFVSNRRFDSFTLQFGRQIKHLKLKIKTMKLLERLNAVCSINARSRRPPSLNNHFLSESKTAELIWMCRHETAETPKNVFQLLQTQFFLLIVKLLIRPDQTKPFNGEKPQNFI